MSTSYQAAERGPEDKPEIPRSTSERDMPPRAGWTGPTYYGRPQLKAAPFDEWLVGGYIFLAGLSGASMLLACIGDATRGKEARITVRNGRYLSMLAPTIGSVLLVADLHTPQRFYNMLRIAKRTSPMSIGTWILMSFSGFAGLSVGGELLARFSSMQMLAQFLARAGQVPAAVTGAGLSTYTATLLSATSTPLWAAVPRSLAVRFGASSMAAAASALALLEPAPDMRRRLEHVRAVALATELVATHVSHRTYEKTGVAETQKSGWGRVEKIGAVGFGVLLPLGLHVAAMLAGPRRGRPLGTAASVAALAGSALLRVSILGAGDDSAMRPEISFRFSQPENLPDPGERWSIREKIRRVMHARNKR
jgi:formate-dependent nitrite reductase membrane component NrfD